MLLLIIISLMIHLAEVLNYLILTLGGLAVFLTMTNLLVLEQIMQHISKGR